jgi:hypothetical protein
MLSGDIIAVCCENLAELTNTLCGQNAEPFNLLTYAVYRMQYHDRGGGGRSRHSNGFTRFQHPLITNTKRDICFAICPSVRAPRQCMNGRTDFMHIQLSRVYPSQVSAR